MEPFDDASRGSAVASPEPLVDGHPAEPATAESPVLSRPSAPVAAQPPFELTAPHNPAQMHVTKRDGVHEPVDVNKIVRAVARCAEGLHAVDAMRVAVKTMGGLYDGATTLELDQLSIRTAAALTRRGTRIRPAGGAPAGGHHRQGSGRTGHPLRSPNRWHAAPSWAWSTRACAISWPPMRASSTTPSMAKWPAASSILACARCTDRYLLRHPEQRHVLETPGYFFMRIACALGGGEMGETLELYRLLSHLEYIPSSPTLFNAGTAHEQLSSCFLLDSPADSLESIYEKYADVAKLSKFAGGIGLAYSRVRSRGSLIRGTNGHSNGLVPWLKTLDASVAAVNQGGKRKGAACVYLEPWHADIEEFLELRDNTGDEARRTHNLNLANWIPDLFMQRVAEDGDWSLFDPKVVPALVDTWGETFERVYTQAESEGKAVRTLKARELYARMLRTLAQTGNGWMTFKDRANATCNQTAVAGNVVHLSNLCTEILEVTSGNETAVCNLGSIILSRHMQREADGHWSFDYDKLADTVRTAVRQLEPRDRSELLPDRRRTSRQHEVAPGGPGRDGPAGCVLPPASGL